MNQYLEAFILGNGAILGNVCMLPLYPGLLAFLAGTMRDGRRQRSAAWLGVLVLVGILSMMLAVGFALYALQRSFGAVLPVLLPTIYGVVILLGGLMIAGRNPFARLAVARSPVLSSPYVTAYAYGLLLGPMTLPCTGPLIVSAFLLGAGGLGSLADGLIYFVVFGLGFGWPLLLLPLLASAAQRRVTGWLARRHTLLERASGALLVGIGLFGLWAEVLPNL